MITITFDGGIDWNPGGTATYGFVIEPDEGEIIEGAGVIGFGEGMTCNVAEYEALIHGLEAALEIAGADEAFAIRGDSRLVLRAMARRHAHRKAPHLKLLRRRALDLLANRPCSYKWIPRSENGYAHSLASAALERSRRSIRLD